VAKTSLISREAKRERLRKKYHTKLNSILEKRAEAIKSGDMEQVEFYNLKLQDIPRNAHPTRKRRRCRMTGRARGNYRKVGLSKTAFREKAMSGEVPGIVKSSW
jgi:small subunit ribosomal protein S14